MLRLTVDYIRTIQSQSRKLKPSDPPSRSAPTARGAAAPEAAVVNVHIDNTSRPPEPQHHNIRHPADPPGSVYWSSRPVDDLHHRLQAATAAHSTLSAPAAFGDPGSINLGVPQQLPYLPMANGLTRPAMPPSAWPMYPAWEQRGGLVAPEAMPWIPYWPLSTGAAPLTTAPAVDGKAAAPAGAMPYAGNGAITDRRPQPPPLTVSGWNIQQRMPDGDVLGGEAPFEIARPAPFKAGAAAKS